MTFENRIAEILEERIRAGGMSGAVVRVERDGNLLFEWSGGRRDFTAGAEAISADDVFLIASITKPMACCGVALLIQEGRIDLDEPVQKYLPEFRGLDKEAVLLRHLFTHTSGLPDMVPDDVALRRQNAPLSAYVASACRANLLFRPGTDVSYQSSGILLLSEIAARVTSTPFPEWLRRVFYEPAGMDSSCLGWSDDFTGRSVACKVVHGPNSDTWNHNSPYWRALGAPWGGAHSNARDIARLLHVMLNRGESESGTAVFAPGLVRAMLADHTAATPGLPERVKQANGWGLGWKLQRLGASDTFGAAPPTGAFGHGGATGTLAWADPESRVSCVILTNGTLVDEGPAIRACSNVIASALCP